MVKKVLPATRTCLTQAGARASNTFWQPILHITNQCTYELFAAQASGTHELKANARVNTSKCNYHIVGALELTLPLYKMIIQ